MADTLVNVLMARDEISMEEAVQQIQAAANEVMEEGTDPEEVLRSNFGLEPDYVFDLLEYMA